MYGNMCGQRCENSSSSRSCTPSVAPWYTTYTIDDTSCSTKLSGSSGKWYAAVKHWCSASSTMNAVVMPATDTCTG